MDFQSTVVVYESLFPESIHEQIDTRARCANHLSKYLVTQYRNLNNFRAPLVQVREAQKHARKADKLLAEPALTLLLSAQAFLSKLAKLGTAPAGK